MQVLYTIAQLHEKAGLTHGDVAAGNVVINADGTKATLVDLGSATMNNVSVRLTWAYVFERAFAPRPRIKTTKGYHVLNR